MTKRVMSISKADRWITGSGLGRHPRVRSFPIGPFWWPTRKSLVHSSKPIRPGQRIGVGTGSSRSYGNFGRGERAGCMIDCDTGWKAGSGSGNVWRRKIFIKANLHLNSSKDVVTPLSRKAVGEKVAKLVFGFGVDSGMIGIFLRRHQSPICF